MEKAPKTNGRRSLTPHPAELDAVNQNTSGITSLQMLPPPHRDLHGVAPGFFLFGALQASGAGRGILRGRLMHPKTP